jgi:RHS repeat-associated protein
MSYAYDSLGLRAFCGYKFTGKERDVESGLDNFGARYNASSLGRFMTPDWAAKPTTVPYASFGDPQTLNLYSYVENAPLNRIDADGHRITPAYQELTADEGNSQGEMQTNATLKPDKKKAQNLIVVGDPGLGEHNQGQNFNRAAQTRAEELEGQGQNVTVVRASSVDDFASALKNNGSLSGVEYFGHASWDRLYVGETSGQGTNIDSSNVGKLSGANLTPNATVTIHACFAGSGGSDSIAGQVSHQLGRSVTAYDGPTHFAPTVTGPNGRVYPASSGPIHLVPDRGTKLVTIP